MAYVDGYILCVPVAKLDEYKKLAKLASKVWLKYGALHYMEAVGDDLDVSKCGMVSFTKLAKPKEGETVIFAFAIYKSRAHRDAVNKKVMADPQLMASCGPTNVPFDCKRMAFGGFKGLVEAKATGEKPAKKKSAAPKKKAAPAKK